jgi:hypothetical protein
MARKCFWKDEKAFALKLLSFLIYIEKRYPLAPSSMDFIVHDVIFFS